MANEFVPSFVVATSLKPTVAQGGKDGTVMIPRQVLHFTKSVGRSEHRFVLVVVARFTVVRTSPLLVLPQVPEAPEVAPERIVGSELLFEVTILVNFEALLAAAATTTTVATVAAVPLRSLYDSHSWGMWPNGPLTLLTRMAEHAAPSMEMRFAGDLPLPLRSCGVWKEDASRATSFVVAAVYASTEGVSASNFSSDRAAGSSASSRGADTMSCQVSRPSPDPLGREGEASQISCS